MRALSESALGSVAAPNGTAACSGRGWRRQKEKACIGSLVILDLFLFSLGIFHLLVKHKNRHAAHGEAQIAYGDVANVNYHEIIS